MGLTAINLSNKQLGRDCCDLLLPLHIFGALSALKLIETNLGLEMVASAGLTNEYHLTLSAGWRKNDV